MSVKAERLYLYTPAVELEELSRAEDAFYDEWLPTHNLDRELFHYTDAGGMSGIVQSRSFWLSNALAVNDPDEVHFGKQLIVQALQKAGVNQPDHSRAFFARLHEEFNEYVMTLHEHFLICFCTSENLLSQWRAYSAAGRGYSLGFTFSDDTRVAYPGEAGNSLKPWFRKVIYNPDQQMRWINRWVELLTDAVKKARYDPPDNIRIVYHAVNILIEMALCFKKPYFEQEDEWRLIYSSSQDHQAHRAQFRHASGLLVPYRSMKLFDKEADGVLKFPLSSITQDAAAP